MDRRILPLFLSFLALALAPVGVAHRGEGQPPESTWGPDAAWEITDHVTCTDDELVVATNITIHAGGLLDLQGCMLRMDSPAYEDQYFSMTNQGLVVRVEGGGELHLAAQTGRPAGVARADSRYGYTIRSEGNVTSLGLPGTPNEVSGLEGSYQGTLALGGFSSAQGHAEIHHTRFFSNTGPGLFVIAGGTLNASNVVFDGVGGLAFTRAGQVVVRELSATSEVGLFASRTADIVLEDCNINATIQGLWLFSSSLVARRCTLGAGSVAVSVNEASNVRLEDSRLDYGVLGIGLIPGRTTEARPAVRAERVAFDPRAGGVAAVHATLAQVELVDCDIPRHPGPSAFLSESQIVATGNAVGLSNISAFQLVNPKRVEIEGNMYDDDAVRAVAIDRLVTMVIVDAHGQPLPAGSNVTIAGQDATTDAEGKARVSWSWFTAEEVVDLDWPKRMPVIIVEAGTGHTYLEAIPGDASVAVIHVGDRNGSPQTGVYLAATMVGGALLGTLITILGRPRPRK